jgi:hypothetical protein
VNLILVIAGIELINKSSEVYKYIHDSKNQLQELTKKLSAVKQIVDAPKKPGKNSKKIKNQEAITENQAPVPDNQKKEEEVPLPDDNQVHVIEVNGVPSQDSSSGSSSHSAPVAEEIKKEDKEIESVEPEQQNGSDNQEANNNEDKSLKSDPEPAEPGKGMDSRNLII